MYNYNGCVLLITHNHNDQVIAIIIYIVMFMYIQTIIESYDYHHRYDSLSQVFEDKRHVDKTIQVCLSKDLNYHTSTMFVCVYVF